MKTQLTLLMPGQIPSSLHIHLLGFCLTLISACSVFKEKSFLQADSLQRQKVDTHVKTEARLKSQAIRIYSTLDSSDKASYTEIFPQGFFRYSAADGFSGKAEKLIVRERLKTTRLLQDRRQEKLDGSLKAELEDARQSKIKTQLKEKLQKPAGISYLYFSGCLLIFVVIFLSAKILEKRAVS